jgi:hypothetical protein
MAYLASTDFRTVQVVFQALQERHHDAANQGKNRLTTAFVGE